MHKAIRAILPFLISGFLFSIILSSTAYFNSTFLESSFPNTKAGFFYTFSAILVLAVSFKLPAIQSKIGNRRTILTFLSILAISLFGLSLPVNGLSKLFFITFLATGTIILSALDIFIEKYSSDEFTGRIRGLYLTSLNLAWIFSPFLGSLFVGSGDNFSLLYKIAFGLSLLVIGSIYINSKNFVDNVYVHHTFRDFWLAFQDKKLRNTLAIQFALQFFYAWMVIYTPIYLHDSLGFSWEVIGKMFLLMLLPFVLIEYPLGRIADKKHDEKELLKTGFLIIGISTILFGTIGALSAFGLAIILFFTRVGAAIVEIMTESYFFKQIGPNEPTKVALFRMMYPVAYILAPILAIPIIGKNNFPIFYTVLASLMVLVLIVIQRIEKIEEEKPI